MNFKEWLLREDDMRTGAKIGLYPSLADSLGQYPPLYVAAAAADFITYYDMYYGKKGVRSKKPGILNANDMAR
jgi:hypothetical protein